MWVSLLVLDSVVLGECVSVGGLVGVGTTTGVRKL